MALTALLLWPIIGLAIFAAIGPVRGLIWTTMVGYLFLPEAQSFNLPLLPPYDKTSAISLSLVLGVLLFRGRLPVGETRLADPGFRRIMLGLLGAIFLFALLTVATNTGAVFTGGGVRQALTIRDALSMWAETLILLTPLLLAWRHLNGRDHAKEICLALILLGFFYTLLVLFEVRMSPQLNQWVYGYFQHSWIQHLRNGDFRPIVFLQHGLWVGFLLLSIIIAAFAMSRFDGRRRVIYLAAGGWTVGVLLLSSNFGATLLAMVFCPAILLTPRVLLIRYAAVISVAFLAYPALKHFSATPVNKVIELVEPIAPDRASSFSFRVGHEAALLNRAFEKPLFGWGGWARARIFDDDGRDQSVTDGHWIIYLGERGWLGYLAFFGFLAVPVLRLAHTAQRKEVPWPVMGITLVCAANFIEMIPNAALTPVSLLFFGAVAAFVQCDVVSESTETTGDGPVRKRPTYSRFGGPVPPVSHAIDRAPEAQGRPQTMPYRR